SQECSDGEVWQCLEPIVTTDVLEKKETAFVRDPTENAFSALLASGAGELYSQLGVPVLPAPPPPKSKVLYSHRALVRALFDVEDAEMDVRRAFVEFAGAAAPLIATQYHGNQFGVYNRHLGDGRGFVLTQFQCE